eukprot:Lankesteria_metandrocarpae@DN4173_c0_g1_i13.p1
MASLPPPVVAGTHGSSTLGSTAVAGSTGTASAAAAASASAAAAALARFPGLVQCLQCVAGGDVGGIKAAEGELDVMARQPGFAASVLFTATQAQLPVPVRQAAAILFKNTVRKLWDVSASHGGIGGEERKVVKDNLLLSLLLLSSEGGCGSKHLNRIDGGEGSNRPVQLQLETALTAIAETDFPHEWPNLFNEIVELHLTNTANAAGEGQIVALRLLHCTLKRYRHAFRSNDTLRQLKMILPRVEQPLLDIFLTAGASLLDASVHKGSASNSNGGSKQWAVTVLLLSCKVFRSLNHVDLPEFYENNMEQYFSGFAQLLRFSHPDMLGDGEYFAGPCQKLWREVASIFYLFSERYQEEFETVVSPCCIAAKDLLVVLSSNPSALCNDKAVSALFAFLSNTALTLWQSQSSPFANSEFLSTICSVVLPNVALRDADLENLSDTPVEYIRRDVEYVESPDRETRRHAALGLVKALSRHYSPQVSSIFSNSLVEALNAARDAGGDNDRRLDAAAELFISLAVKSQTRVKGAHIRDTYEVEQFFDEYLVRYLRRTPEEASNAWIVGRAAAAKFAVTFRVQFTTNKLTEIVTALVELLTAGSSAVCIPTRSYAAHAIERILSVRVNVLDGTAPPTTNYDTSVVNAELPWKYKIDKEAVKPVFLPCVEVLLRDMQSDVAASSPSSCKNEFFPKCLLRIIYFLGDKSVDIAVPTLKALLTVIAPLIAPTSTASDSNPTTGITATATGDGGGGNPLFTHYTFDLLALLLRTASSAGGPPAELEAGILTTLAPALREPAHEYGPYALQVLALLLDSTAVAAPIYAELYTRILEPLQWTSSASNVPAIVRLLEGYFRKYTLFKSTIDENVTKLMERYQYCLYHKRISSEAFNLLRAAFQYLPVDVYLSNFEMLLKVTLGKLQEQKTDDLCQQTMLTFCLFTAKNGSKAALLATSLENIQPGLAASFFQHIFLPPTRDLSSFGDKKLAIVALALLAGTQEVQQACSEAIISDMLLVIASIMTNAEEWAAEATGSVRKTRVAQMKERDATLDTASGSMCGDSSIEGEEYQGMYNKLSTVQVAAKDRIAEVTDVTSFLTTMMTNSATSLSGLPAFATLRQALGGGGAAAVVAATTAAAVQS